MRKPNLDAIRRRAAAATPGPWRTGDRFLSGSLSSSVAVLSGKLPPVELDPRRNGRADAAFIAHARQDIPAPLAEIDRRDRLLRFVKLLHRYGDLRDDDGFTLCAECGKPHPCETYRSAAGDPGWPRSVAGVLSEMDEQVAGIGLV